MATTKQGQETPRVALAQIEDLMKGSGKRADALRADGLAGLVAVKRAKVVQTRRERSRMAVRHGEASEEVARLDRQLSVEHRVLVNSRAEADRVSTPQLERIADAWQVHGYLRSRDGLGRAGYGVSLLADVDGRKVLAETTTNKRGYFHIVLGSRDKATDTIGGGRDEAAAAARAEAGAAREEILAERSADKDRMARVLVQSLKSAAYLGVAVPGQTGLTVDERPLYPAPGAIAYRDLTVANPKDDGQSCQIRTRLLGNSGTRELHDLDNEKSGCQIGEIRPDHRFYFRSIEEAEKLKYDFCAYCFGRARSKR